MTLRNLMPLLGSYGSAGAGEGNLPLYPDPGCEEIRVVNRRVGRGDCRLPRRANLERDSVPEADFLGCDSKCRLAVTYEARTSVRFKVGIV